MLSPLKNLAALGFSEGFFLQEGHPVTPFIPEFDQNPGKLLYFRIDK